MPAFLQPPPGVRIDANDLIQFERVRHEHQLAPKNPSSVRLYLKL